MSEKIELTITKAPLSHQVKDSILELIHNGTLKKGDRLTPEADLARQYKLSRTTVRSAMMELAGEGIIKRFPKRGSFVALTNPASVMKIGIVSPIIPLTTHLSHFFQAEILQGFQHGFLKTQASFVYLEHASSGEKLYEQVEDTQVDGIILVAPFARHLKILERMQDKGIPAIVLSAAVDKEEYNFIATDNRKGSELAVKHLFILGHRRITAVFAAPDAFDSRDRYEGYLGTLGNYNLPDGKETVKVLPPGDCQENSYRAVKGIISDRSRPSAIFATGPEIALGAKKAIEDSGMKIPDDISLVGFDDAPPLQYSMPPITTVVQPIREIGRLGVEKLIELIREKQKTCRISLQPELIVRGSTRQIDFQGK